MSRLNESINAVQTLLNDIDSALIEQGIDTSKMKPGDYPNAIRSIVNNVTEENIGYIPTLIWKYTSENAPKPITPVGGKWNISESSGNSNFEAPDGWFVDTEDMRGVIIDKDQIWMSFSLFKNDGVTQYMNWTSPIRISGKNGIDGKTGAQGAPGNIAGIVQTFYTPIYYATLSEAEIPNRPSCTYDLSNATLNINSQGWRSEIDSANSKYIWWQSVANYQSNQSIVSCSNPVRISAAPKDIVEGVNNYYLLTDTNITPSVNDPDWILENDGGFPTPTLDKRFLWIKTTTVFSNSVNTSPVYLLTKYQKGLNSIDFDYYCAPTQQEVENLAENLWFETSEEALIKTDTYRGLDETTKYLWCRETFVYDDSIQHFYRIISTYTASEKGAIVYSAGVFNNRTNYTRTAEQTPYIYYPDGLKINDSGEIDNNGKEYYYFVLKYGYDDTMHKININDSDYSFSKAYANKNWEKMESFEAIYSDIGIFKSALVGKFVFDDKYIFSQDGVDKDGVKRSYTDFVDYSTGVLESEVGRIGVALAIESDAFIPNVLIDAITGNVKFGHGSTYFENTGKGALANGNITWNEQGHIVIGDTQKGFIKLENGNLVVSGKIQLSSDSTGLSNLKEWETVTSDISKLNKTVEQVQDQIDGVVENYFINGAPSLFNEPYISWKTDNEKLNHVGDTYTNIDEIELNDKGENINPDAGKSWRWCECGESGAIGKETLISTEHSSNYTKVIGTLSPNNYTKVDVYYNGSKDDTINYVQSGYWIYTRDGFAIKIDPNSLDVTVWDDAGTHSNVTITLEFIYEDAVTVTTLDGQTKKLHWHPIADSDAVKALIEAHKANNRVDDLNYLTDAFGGKVIDNKNGLILGQMMAVSNSDDEIEAFINGSDIGLDDEHGKLLFASGIDPDSTATLDEKSKLAKTKIYEDGFITSSNLHLENGCKIGDGIKVEENSIKIDSDNFGEVSISETEGIHITGMRKIDSEGEFLFDEDFDIMMGSNCGTGAMEIKNGSPLCYNYRRKYLSSHPGQLTWTEKESGACVGLNISAGIPWNQYTNSDIVRSTDSFAIVMPAGMTAGLRPKVTVLSEDDNISYYGDSLSNLDYCVLVSDEQNTRNIILPTNPGVGQHIEIIKKYNANITIDSGTIPVYCASGDWSGTNGNIEPNITKIGKGYNRTVKYVFNGEYWHRSVYTYS